jgi:hypothetical protein
MKSELVKATRPELPKYFPPGYFVWSFWLMAGINVGNHIWCIFWAVYQASKGNTIALLAMCAIEALNVMTSMRTVRMMRRHSREWRTEERPRMQAWITEREKHMQQMAEEFAEFLNKRNEGSK